MAKNQPIDGWTKLDVKLHSTQRKLLGLCSNMGSNDLFIRNSLIPYIDYTHVMSALMKYYIKPFFTKDDPDRRFWINVCRVLYFAESAFESDVILFQMFIFGLTQKNSTISRSFNWC